MPLSDPTELRLAAIREILPATPFEGQVVDDDDDSIPSSKKKVEFLMVQRKDSLSFVEFVRGKYNIQNRGYLLKLLSGMTTEERGHLITKSFDELWHGFWQSGHSRTFLKEYEQSKARFTMLKSGYYIRPVSNLVGSAAGEEFFSLAVALNSTTSTHADTEFGFPKGRRNINETDLQCALREFSEETGVLVSDITVLSNVGPCEEIFTGSNGVRYRHVYYVAELKPESRVWDDVGVIPVVDPVQLREVKSVGWFDAEGVMERLRVENHERREMFVQLSLSLGGDPMDQTPTKA
jgi:8-oxo-dGTP pyrophosphatase MutT (NUDIX family)